MLWLRSTLVKAETMPERCVVFGCNNVRSKEKGILLHPISFYGKSESEKQTGRRKWIDFVKSKRAHLEHTEHSAMCTEHFIEEDYTNRFADYLVRRLKRDEIGVCVFPSKHARCVRATTELQLNLKLWKWAKQTKGEIFLSISQSACHILFINACQDFRIFLQMQ